MTLKGLKSHRNRLTVFWNMPSKGRGNMMEAQSFISLSNWKTPQSWNTFWKTKADGSLIWGLGTDKA